MMDKDEARRMVESKLQQIIDEFNNHVTREAYEKLDKERGKAIEALLKASGI